jgi:hypothetical protein
MNKQERTRVHIVVRKGMVESIYSNDDQMHAVVIDYDKEMDAAEKEGMEQMEQEFKDKDHDIPFDDLQQ